jgi:hypothetical protein
MQLALASFDAVQQGFDLIDPLISSSYQDISKEQGEAYLTVLSAEL